MERSENDSNKPAFPRSLAAQGDAGDVSTWSNIPYFFFQAAKKQNFLTHALNLKDPRYEAHRKAWRLKSLLRLRRPAWYQYSDALAKHLWKLVPDELKHGEILSHMQFFPRVNDARKSGTAISFYIDATLRLFWNNDRLPNLSSAQSAEIIAGETERYHLAKCVVAMANETRRSLIDDYKIDPRKVFVVRPGANLEESQVQKFLETRRSQPPRTSKGFSKSSPAVLGFIGNDYQRKGLYRLMEAAEELNRRGRPVIVRAIGKCPENLQNHPLINWLGPIDKAREAQRFLQAVDSFAIGCLLSSAEPLGISTLECLRLGVPVIGTRVGGIPDCIPEGAGILLPANADCDVISDALEESLFTERRYEALCENAMRQMPQVTWSKSTERMIEIWNSL